VLVLVDWRFEFEVLPQVDGACGQESPVKPDFLKVVQDCETVAGCTGNSVAGNSRKQSGRQHAVDHPGKTVNRGHEAIGWPARPGSRHKIKDR
jgi:hypothetical protein